MLFITVIFPNGVNGLVCHLRMSVLIFCNTLAKLISGIASISVEKSMPKGLNSDLPQSKHSVTLSLSFDSLFFPIQITFVFSLPGNIFGLILKNKMATTCVFLTFSKEFCWPSRKKGIIGRDIKFAGYVHH